MTDTATSSSQTDTDPESSVATEASDTDTGGSDRSIRTYAMWAAFAILVLVALVATFQFYFAASAAISEFVTRRYRPLFRAGFNLLVLLASGLGISLLVRRLA
ncbi:hypothetical protein ACFQJ5_10905 [Halomicroarcula sp. GCM10025324]|jgi:hypothetical protein|uniref:hypothetical protein n=1 Tax=Haloarcula TaxID=2237 RepID=UPI0023E8C74B|nr:hypothetical protein [Halomicroarcula sp. ZS-22-S1]